MVKQRRASRRIVSEIARYEGVDPVELDRQLYDAIDPGALDGLLQSGNEELEVTFAYLDYWITATGDGRVDVAGDDTPVAE